MRSTKLKLALEAIDRDERKAPIKSYDDVRASSVCKLCPRMHALSAVLNLKCGEVRNVGRVWPLAVGSGYHYAFQSEILRLMDVGIFQGWWRRPGELMERDDLADTMFNGTFKEFVGAPQDGALPFGWIPRPEGEGWEYRELVFTDRNHGITGHCDGVLVWPGEEPELLELKTANERSFGMVSSSIGGHPFPEHEVQAQLYMWMAGLKRARLVYIDKTADGFAEALCEYEFAYRPDVIETLLVTLRQTRTALTIIERLPKIEERVEAVPQRLTACRIKSDKRAKYCEMRDACFHKSLLALARERENQPPQ